MQGGVEMQWLILFLLFSLPLVSALAQESVGESVDLPRILPQLPSSGSQGVRPEDLPHLNADQTPAPSSAPAPGGLLPPLGGQAEQPGGVTVTPPSPQVTVRWKQFDLSQAFGYDPLIRGVVEFPEGWLVNVDTFNRSVTFAEDSAGLVALSAYLAIQNPAIHRAEDLAQEAISLLSQNVANLSIQSQDFRQDPKAAQAGFSVTYGRVVLTGNFQGRALTIFIQPYVLYSSVAQYSIAGVLLLYAPTEVFQEKLQTYFNRMITAFEATAGASGTVSPQ